MPQTPPAPHSPAVDLSGPEHKRNMGVIRLLLVSAFVVILNETLMGNAIPRLIDDLGITATAAQWLTTAFMLTLAVVIPITGFLMQRFQTRPMFLAAMSLFTLGTVIAAVSPGFELLLVGRVVQASGTAIMMPLLFTTVFALVPPAIRGRVVGNISIVIAVAPALGPTVSGAILQIADWRWLFIVMVPFAIVALALGAARIVNVGVYKPGRLDVLSVVLSALGFGGFVYGLAQLGEGGEGDGGSSIPLIALIGGAAIIGLFVWRQTHLQRSDAALLDLRTFASRQFALSIAIVTIASMALFGAIILLPLYVQEVLGYDALAAGLAILPGALLQGILAPFIGRRYDAVGPRGLVLIGSVLLIVSLAGMSMFTEGMALWLVTAAHIGVSLGLALLFTPLLTNGLSSLRPELNAHGSAIVGTIQQVAGAAGIALFITLSAAFAGPAAEEGAAITAEGIRAAFTVGTGIALITLPLVLFVRRVTAPAGGPGAGGTTQPSEQTSATVAH